jgi:chromate reductase
MKIAAISGSLRHNSSNTGILKALKSYAGDNVELEIFDGLDKIPYFSAEKDTNAVDPAVADFRSFIHECDALIFCTPEYAFGMPGVLKNALEWLVSSTDIYRKPVATISASITPMGGDKAHDSLRLVLTALGVDFIDGAKITVPSMRLKIDSAGNIIDSKLEKELRQLLESVTTFVIKTEKD